MVEALTILANHAPSRARQTLPTVKVAINTLSVTDDNEGIRTMISGLVPALVRADRSSRFRLICSKANVGLFSTLSGEVDVTLVGESRRRPLVRIAHDQLSVPRMVSEDTDVLLTPSTVGSLLARVPQVVVVVAHLALPSVRREAGDAPFSAMHRVYYGPVMRLSHRRADAVVTISRFLADRLVSDTGVAPSKVWPIPLGIDPPPERVDDPVAKNPCVLFVSTLYPYKNAQLLVRAAALAATRLSAPLTAVIVGRDPDGEQLPALRRLANELGIADSIKLCGRVSAAKLDELYAEATVVVFPSRAEGFGFAALEGMARGVPTIVSDRMSLPEVVGDAGVLIDPDCPGALADAIVDIVCNPAKRAELAKAGHERAKQLSWDTTARLFTEVFQTVVSKRTQRTS